MKLTRAMFITIISLILCVSIVNAQSGGPIKTALDSDAISPDADIQFNTLYASANTSLWMIDAETGLSTYIGEIGYQGTDIAFFLGNLYGISFSQFLWIDPVTGEGHVIGPMGYNDVNGLTIGRDGTVYATTLSGHLLRIDITTGQATDIGYMGDGYHSAGDVAISDDDHLYAAVSRDGYWNSWLVYLNRENGAATPIGDIGFDDVWGLSFKDGQLFGVTPAGKFISIDTSNGSGTLVNTSTADFWGLSTSGKAVIGSITSPPDNYTTGPASVPINATAEYPGGPGILQVEFYSYSDIDQWRSHGSDTSVPYSALWTPQAGLHSQQILLRIDVVGTDLERTDYAGGVRRMNFIESLGNPNLNENWVGNRAYLNQRSLGDEGDDMCSTSSMTMILAMEDLIDHDYQTMADKAVEMYPRVLGDDGRAYVYLMRDELENQGADAYYFGPLTNDDGWDYLTAYINTGHSVIIRSEQGVLTEPGHYIVAVGYQENGDERLVIAYDPFGMWRGMTCEELGTPHCSGNYYTNASGDPTSHVGQWVYYDFDTIFGEYLIVPAAPKSSGILGDIVPSSTPDLISDEQKIVGTNPGIFYGDKIIIFIPFVNR